MPDAYRSQFARILALGFGMTVAMWAVGYVAMMRPGLVVGEALFALTLACLVLGGVVAGRSSHTRSDAVKTGLQAGVLSAVLNLLIIGSLIGGDSTAERLMSFGIWSGGALGVSMGLAALGAAVAWRGGQAIDASRGNWYHRFACVSAVTVFLLLITGGLVTGHEAGLAVPDWPNTFGHNMLLYPLEEMVGDEGVYYEHAHRLYGMLVGVASMVLAVTLILFDRRAWLRRMGFYVLLMVCYQGLLGGLRVTGHLTLSADPDEMIPNTILAVVHGVFGQVVFAAIVAIAAFTSTTWLSSRPSTAKLSAGSDRSMSLALVVMLIVQLALGALYRHLRRDAGDPMEHIHWLYVHIFLAAIVTALAIFVGGRLWAFNKDQPILPRLGKAMVHTVGFQLLLGILALISVIAARSVDGISIFEVTMTTMHQATGALLLALAALAMLWIRRLLVEP